LHAAGSISTDFEYVDRLGVFRSAIIVVTVAFFVYLFWTNDASHPGLRGVGVTLLAFIVYGQQATKDVKRGLVTCADD